MQKHFAFGLITSALLSSLSSAGGAPANDPSLDLTHELKAASANAALGERANVLGRIVGTWDVEYTDYAKDGTAMHRTGEFIVGWIMDGQAVQDLWIVNPSGTRKERELYTDLHWFDAKAKTWRATFVDPEHGSIAKFTGGPVGEDRY